MWIAELLFLRRHPLVTLVHVETLKVLANVLEKDIALVKIGMKVKILTEAYPDKPFEGTIVRINKALDLATRTLQAEINIPNPGRLLKPGMFARIEVVLEGETGRPRCSERGCAEGGRKTVRLCGRRKPGLSKARGDRN